MSATWEYEFYSFNEMNENKSEFFRNGCFYLIVSTCCIYVEPQTLVTFKYIWIVIQWTWFFIHSLRVDLLILDEVILTIHTYFEIKVIQE